MWFKRKKARPVWVRPSSVWHLERDDELGECRFCGNALDGSIAWWLCHVARLCRKAPAPAKEWARWNYESIMSGNIPLRPSDMEPLLFIGATKEAS